LLKLTLLSYLERYLFCILAMQGHKKVY